MRGDKYTLDPAPPVPRPVIALEEFVELANKYVDLALKYATLAERYADIMAKRYE